MEYRRFGQTHLHLSAIGLGGLLTRYEAHNGHPPPEEKRRIYLRAEELGINLFDLGYGDEVYVPDELKGPKDDRYFSLKAGAPAAAAVEDLVDKHLTNIRREAIDILRVHHYAYLQNEGLAEQIAALKDKGKVRAMCTIRHMLADQQAYAARGPEEGADADLVIYNYVCRWQAPGIERSAQTGKGGLIMKAVGGPWLNWADQAQANGAAADAEQVIELAPKGEGLRPDLPLIYPIVKGPWQELCEPGEAVPRTNKAIDWVLATEGVHTALVAFASVEELEEGLGVLAGVAG